MTAYLLDTNVIAELAGRRPAEAVNNWLRKQALHNLHISGITLGEYQKGLHKLALDNARRAQIAADITNIEGAFGERILLPDIAILKSWGRMLGEDERRRALLPESQRPKRLDVTDALIAATAIEHELVLVTRNMRDMSRTGARLLNPWEMQA